MPRAPSTDTAGSVRPGPQSPSPRCLLLPVRSPSALLLNVSSLLCVGLRQSARETALRGDRPRPRGGGGAGLPEPVSGVPRKRLSFLNLFAFPFSKPERGNQHVFASKLSFRQSQMRPGVSPTLNGHRRRPQQAGAPPLPGRSQPVGPEVPSHGGLLLAQRGDTESQYSAPLG